MRPSTPAGRSATPPVGGADAVPTPRRAVEPPAAGADPAASPGLIGPAWIVREVTHVPGVLRLDHGRLSFVSTRSVLFDRPRAELPDLSFPWYGFSGAFRVTVGGERLRVHVVRPAGAVDPAPAFVAGLLDAAGLPTTDGDGEAGSRWRAALDPPGRLRGRRG